MVFNVKIVLYTFLTELIPPKIVLSNPLKAIQESIKLL